MTQQADWYKDVVIYEVPVRAFHDSVADGHGDFAGLTQKLDYLEDLGVSAIWILPFYPSPQRDDGYDIADYTSIHPQYGSLADFKAFLAEAHRRGLRVITELVLNHTSDQHPWFQRARRAPRGSVERDFYVWSDTPDKYDGVRIIFQDFEPSNWTWDPVAGQYYWHRFYHHQPDLNFDNPAVRAAILPVVDFWFNLGVDGMRLDAVPYLFEREGTTCENLPETHAFLKTLRRHVDERFPGRMFLAEANQWPEDAISFFGQGDECHMAFHFPLMPRLYMALHEENNFPIVDILAQTPPIPENCQWCLFLRNHDELTLEMVTDEERDYMYRAYTRESRARINAGIRHRLAPLLRNDRRRIELLNALLFSLPGTPVIYYGDEIGMGDNIYLGDRNGVRTPMQWSADRNAGFSRANAQKLYLPIIIDPEYHYEAVNVEAQQNNPSSLLWWMKRLVALRKQHRAFSRGSLEMLRPDNPKVLAFLRKYQDERLLVVANLSRFVQPVRLNLREYAGWQPEELFGRTTFPNIGEQPYFLTLAPHSFQWFALTPPRDPAQSPARQGEPATLPGFTTQRYLAERFDTSTRDELEALLPGYLRRRNMLTDQDPLTLVEVPHVGHVVEGNVEVWFVVARFEYRSGNTETLALPLTFLPPERLGELLVPLDIAGFARVNAPVPGVLCNALAVPDCCRAIVRSILGGRSLSAGTEQIVATVEGTPQPPGDLDALPLRLVRGEHRNTALFYGETYFLKTFRRLEAGINPDLEVGRYLNRHPEYTGAAPVVGALEYHQDDTVATLAVLHNYVPHQGTAWQVVLDHLGRFFERVAALPREAAALPLDEWLDGFPETARLLGRRTADLHRTLAADPRDAAFAPEGFTRHYQRSLYQSLRNLTERVCRVLEAHADGLPQPARDLARQLIGARDVVLSRYRPLLEVAFGGQRIRCHGNYHLGQLLHTGKDVVVVDFEGDASRTVSERRIKRSPLRDVACLMRSFDYAVGCVLLGLGHASGPSPGHIRAEDRGNLLPWAQSWLHRMTQELLAAYNAALPGNDLLPAVSLRSELLAVLLLEKALHEIEEELTARPVWAGIPLQGAARLLGLFG